MTGQSQEAGAPIVRQVLASLRAEGAHLDLEAFVKGLTSV
jgi:hypothetical protein